LFLFCEALASCYLDDLDRTQELFDIARADVEFFQGYANKQHSKFKFRKGEEPPFQLIIAKDGRGERIGIFYFASSEIFTLKDQVSGFVTQDHRMTNVMERLFDYSSKAAMEFVADPRTDLQRDRDNELIVWWDDHKEPYEVPAGDIVSGLRLIVHQNIFPPDISLGGKPLLEAVSEAMKIIWKEVDGDKRLGVDIGTGSGIIALKLATNCSRVWATDIGVPEIENAKENFRRFNNIPKDKCEFDARQGNLFDPLPDFPPKWVPLIVFNQPFYPSAHQLIGTGGPNAGLEIIRQFLQAAKSRITKRGGVVMPYSEVAKEHNPLTIAVELGYKAQVIGTFKDTKYGNLYVYLFTI
jgi:methylase of polypeptide subunit release factors